MKIGFIGLGKMGVAMARNLVRSGHQLKVYNRTRAKAEPVVQLGAKVAETAADAAHGAEAVFTMLADDEAVSQAVEQFKGALDSKAIHIGSSTISVALAKHLGSDHAAAGQRYISAPVFGRPDAAESKRLVVVAAGDGSSLEECHPLLEAIGRATFVVGAEPWQANAVKLCGNFLIASMLEALSEAFATLRKAGVDPNEFLNPILEVFGSPVYTNYGKQMAAGNFNIPGSGFGLALGLKDVRLVSQFAESVQSPMPLASLIRDHLVSAMAHGQSDLDWTSLALVLARSAGVS
jgi:3-hydroxyisobutyrate dehydrogenase-like beta-hydroxyacid dehydrogenase